MYEKVLNPETFKTANDHDRPEIFHDYRNRPNLVINYWNQAGKAGLSPVRVADYEPPVQTGEPTRVASVHGRCDKPTHRSYKSSKSHLRGEALVTTITRLTASTRDRPHWQAEERG